jgi:hypothetical protein
MLIGAMCALALTACGDGPSEPVTQPTFEYELTVTGAQSATMKGTAYFGADTDLAGDSIFLLLLGGEASTHLVMVGKAGAERPGVGTYPVGDVAAGGSPWSGLFLVTEDEDLGWIYIAEEGSVVVTASSATLLKGTIEFRATELFGEAGGAAAAVQVSGRFEARPAPTGAARQAVSRAVN